MPHARHMSLLKLTDSLPQIYRELSEDFSEDFLKFCGNVLSDSHKNGF